MAWGGRGVVQRRGEESVPEAAGSTVRLKSPVNWAVLGLVLERPTYGYELVTRLERRYSGVLEPKQSHIYDALDRLERAGLIEPMPEDASDGNHGERNSTQPSRRSWKLHYRATALGSQAFREYVASLLRNDDPRQLELLRRIGAVVALHQIDALEDLVDRFEDLCLEEAGRLGLPPSRDPNAPSADTVRVVVERLMVKSRHVNLEAQFAWLADAREEIAFLRAAHEDPGNEPAGT